MGEWGTSVAQTTFNEASVVQIWGRISPGHRGGGLRSARSPFGDQKEANEDNRPVKTGIADRGLRLCDWGVWPLIPKSAHLHEDSTAMHSNEW